MKWIEDRKLNFEKKRRLFYLNNLKYIRSFVEKQNSKLYFSWHLFIVILRFCSVYTKYGELQNQSIAKKSLH